jgi:hypothetical protein
VIPALGPSDEILVICEGGEESEAGKLLKQILEREVYTVEMERAFNVILRDVVDFGQVRDHKVVFLLGTWEEGAIADFVGKYLEPDIARSSTQVQVFEDVWAKWQAVLVLMDTDEKRLRNNLLENIDPIFDLTSFAVRDRIRRSMFADGENMQVEETLRSEHGWTIRIPLEYKARQAGDNFVWLEKDDPPRLLFVLWRDAQESDLTSGYVIDLRNWAGMTFYDGDKVEWQRDIIVEENVKFAGYDAMKIVGTWGNEKYVAGGPFRTFAVFSPEQERLYLVDIAVYAPGRDKLPHLRELMAIAGTFKITPPIPEKE